MSLGRYAIVYQTEVMTLLACAQRLEDLKTVGRDICICSDSQVALRTLAVPATYSQLVEEGKGSAGKGGRAKQAPSPLCTGIYWDQGQRDARSDTAGLEPYVGIAKCWARSTIRK